MAESQTPGGNVIYTTDFFLVPDKDGNMRKVYRFGCARCGKLTDPGMTFCQGHRYMEGTPEGSLRAGLEEIEKQEQAEQEKPTTLLDAVRRWVRGRGDGATP